MCVQFGAHECDSALNTAAMPRDSKHTQIQRQLAHRHINKDKIRACQELKKSLFSSFTLVKIDYYFQRDFLSWEIFSHEAQKVPSKVNFPFIRYTSSQTPHA